MALVDDKPNVCLLGNCGFSAIEAADNASGLKPLQSDVRLDLPVTDVSARAG